MASNSKLNKPIEKVYHRTASVGDSLYVWAGCQAGLPGVHDNTKKRRITSNIEHFSLSAGQWITRDTTGTPPLGVRAYCCTAINDQLYYFGGWCGHDNCYHNSVSQLDTFSLQWRELEPTNATRPVMRRANGGIISFEHDGVHHLLMIGGTGSKPAVKLRDYKYIKLHNGNWCTNEHSMYNISSRKWSNPSIIGHCIPPSSFFIIESIDNSKAVLFGGTEINDDKKTSTSNIYILEISISTVSWQCIKKPKGIYQWPVRRCLHAGAIIMTGSNCPMLVISGGWDMNNDMLNDCWIFNITQHSWIKLDVPHSVSKRFAHSLSVFIMNPHCVCIITVGGGDYNGRVADPKIVMFNKLVLNSNGEWTVGDTLDTNGMYNEEYKEYQQQLQTERRIQAFMMSLEEKERKLQEMERKEAEKENEIRRYLLQLQMKEREKQEALQEKDRENQVVLQQKDKELQEKDRELWEKNMELREKDRELWEKNMELREKDRELQEKDRELWEKNMELREKDKELQEEDREKDKELQEKDKELQEKDRELQEKDRELREKNMKLREKNIKLRKNDRELQKKDRELWEKDGELQEKNRELYQSQEAVRRYQKQALTDDHWVINKDEVTLTKEELGRGSYAVVTVGIFKGLRVAVKLLHTLIISDYNQGLFSREMSIASRVRHPNLVQFIGATKVDNPLILTELMSTSLSHELSRLTNQQILSIAQDVALGLNYLHLFKPQPIIHRNVSSPNVLLKPCTGPAGYEAKVADYCTAKLQQGTSTVGNPAYAAREAPIPDQHSPAMDVYSYSVLLMEMSLHCPPEMTIVKRAKQSGSVSWSDMRSLIQGGLKADPRERHTMAQVIESLKFMHTF